MEVFFAPTRLSDKKQKPTALYAKYAYTVRVPIGLLKRAEGFFTPREINHRVIRVALTKQFQKVVKQCI